MATDFNVSPYYDDFSEDKNFHKVLFRPAYAVQARELTQLQTILQNQVQRFGQHIFKEGSQVIPGEVTLFNAYDYVKLSSFSTSAVSSLEDILLTGGTSGVVGLVVNSQVATTTTAATLFITYTKAGTDNSAQVFTDGETLTGTNSSNISVSAVVGVSGTVLPITTDATGKGSSVKVEEGVYFVDGLFVKNTEQTLVLEAYDRTPSYRVGFTITESFITPEEDTALKDNATGSSNVNAPGAHRYKVSLTLAKLSLTSTEDSSFVELMKVNYGIVETKVIKTEYNILEDTFARRTYDESGNYITKPFDIDVREHHWVGNNASNVAKYGRGIFSQNITSGLWENLFTEDESQARLAIGLSPGKAYVYGYEIETQSTKYETVKKARDAQEINNSTVSLQLGNYLDVRNVYGSVDVGTVAGETEAFKELILNKDFTVTRGVVRGTVNNDVQQIGRAKPRFFEYSSGTAGANATLAGTSSVYKLGLFDIQMFQHISVGSNTSFVTGEILTGSSGGATGVIESPTVSSTTLDKIVLENEPDSSIVLDSTDGSANAGSQVALESSSYAVIVLSNVKGTFLVSETVSDETGNSSTISKDAPEKQAITIYDISQTKQITQAGTPTFTCDPVMTSTFSRKLLSNLPLRGTVSVSSGSTTLRGSGSNFLNQLLVGDQIEFTDSNGTSRQVIISTIDSSTNATLRGKCGTVTGAVARLQRAKLNDIENTSLVYKMPEDTIKTLKTTTNSGVTDSNHKVRRQFVETLSSDGTVSFTSGANETFSAHAEADFTMSIMSATAANNTAGHYNGDIISLDGQSHESATIFSLGGSPTGRTLTIDLGTNLASAKVKLIATINRSVADEKGKTLVSAATATITTQALAQESSIGLGKADIYALTTVHMAADFSTTPTTSDTDITDRFTLDNGQRDSFYDVGRINLKTGQQAPTGRLLITFDYFQHGAGDYFSADSYAGVIDYGNIPSFKSPTKGKLELRDCIDFRPRVSDDSNVIGYNNSASIDSKNFVNTGAATVDMIKPGDDFTSDFEFYLSRIDGIYLTKTGFFECQQGASAIDPQRPDPLDDGMLLYYLRLPAYTFNTSDVIITPIDNRRYTMRDIGKIEKRVENLEYYTQLSLLEQTALNTQVQDSEGLDRFKNGFLVDTFKGHNVGDALSLDYAAAMDMEEGTVRPLFYSDQVSLEETNTTDAERTADGYKKTGDLITLPYTEQVFVENTLASKSVYINPFAVSQMRGNLKLTPDLDEWKDTNVRPDLIVNNENLYDAIKDIPNPSHALGTTWNEWQTNWTGSFVEKTQSGYITTTKKGRTGTATRSGISRTLTNKVVKQSFGERIVDTSFVPYIRAQSISFSATGMKPNTKVYPFFDEYGVTNFVTPTGGVIGGQLTTDTNGAVSGTFDIPDPSASTKGLNKWRTGERLFRLSSHQYNSFHDVDVDTFADAKFIARGLQITTEETIYSTRVPIVASSSVSGFESRKTIDSSTTVDNTPPAPNPNGGNWNQGGGNDDQPAFDWDAWQKRKDERNKADDRLGGDYHDNNNGSGSGSSDNSSSSGGGYTDNNSPPGGGGYCFDPSTPIQMADGSTKQIKNIQLGDDTKGGEVTGVFQFKASDEMHNYKGVTVAGSHYVKENNEFIMVEDSPLAVKIDKIPVVYSLDTSDRRIFINDIEFADYNGDGVAKNFLNNAGIGLRNFDKEVLRQVEQRLI